MHGSPTSRRGFTLIEVLIVVAIIGIAGAVIVPQMLKAGTLQIQAAGRMIISDLLIAQNEAVAKQAPRRVVFDVNANRYSITDGNGNAIPALWRTGGDNSANYAVDLTQDGRFNGVRLSKASFNNTASIQFDALGGPDNGGTVELTSGNTHYRITVAPFTGRVTIVPF
ncbi:MAG: GspH/FimT family pseudopilin [Planctomycetes bacterium]|nr:GspH/FimT family pseudopilin [Planctomycetota bacterium]